MALNQSIQYNSGVERRQAAYTISNSREGEADTHRHACRNASAYQPQKGRRDTALRRARPELEPPGDHVAQNCELPPSVKNVYA
jgi:hypothetical protein